MMKNKILILSMLFWLSFSCFGQGENIFIDLEFNKEKWIDNSENLHITPNGATVGQQSSVATFISKKILIGFDSIGSFITVSFSSGGHGFDTDQIHFKIRTKNKEGWSDWQAVHHAHEVAPQESHFVSQLLFYDLTCEELQFKVELSGNQTKAPVIESMRLNVFNPLKKSGEPEKINRSKGYNSGCYCPLPDFYNRNEWGCPDGQVPSCTWPSYTNVSHLVVHHSATSNTSNNWPAVVLSFWDYHVNSHGWCDIGYNWLVDPEGNLYEGRGGGDNVKGAHFSCANAYTLGVCVIGNFTDTVPTAEATDKLIRLLAWKCCKKELSPTEIVYHSPTELDLPTVCGHRDANESTASSACPGGTACPGDSLYPELDEIRFAVDSLMNVPWCGGPPPPANDSCGFAQELVYSQQCEFVSADVTGATPGGLDAPECSEYNGFPAMEDVWFSFVADTTAMGIKVLPTEDFDPVVALYNGCQGEELACSDHGGGVGNMEFIDYYDFIVGETYFVRVYHYGQLSPLTPGFEICLSNPFKYPLADFEALTVHGGTPLTADFFDLSANEPTSWTWTFEGGTPQISNEQNPAGIIFEEPGLYDVSLWISNEHGENEIIKEKYIHVDLNGIDTYADNTVSVFPNPATGLVNVTSEQKIERIEFINQHGQQIHHIDHPAKTTTTDLSNYSDGLYIVKVYSGDNPLVFRLINISTR
ncbi:MAG: N-acetylmuramoyl-L-alanine amidase [Bacteroidota bacterium]